MSIPKKPTYKSAYDELGNVRLQQDIAENLPQETRRRKKSDKDKGFEKSEFEKFWGLRRDIGWSELPGRMVYNRKKRSTEFVCTVTQILLHLAPASAFNPCHILEQEEMAEKALIAEELKRMSESSDKTVVKKKEKDAKLSKADQIVQVNTRKMSDADFLGDVTRIRNSKKNLMTLLSQIRLPKTRLVLMIEILRNALDAGEKDLVFEALWAIEEVGIQKFDAPQPANERDVFGVSDPSLVYDKFANVEKLVEKARKLKSKEKDMVKLQLLDMSDSLPPLSKFTHGYKFDPWQRRVMGWIKADKSVIICAPTSSGKTVLSSIVALIGKNKAKVIGATDQKVRKAQEISKGIKDEDEISGDEDDDEGDDDEEGEDEGDEEEGEEDEGEDEDTNIEVDVRGMTINKEGKTAGSEGKEREKERGIDSKCAGFDFAFQDRLARMNFRESFADGAQKVLFVVPSEPLVWQVAAFFSQLLRDEGDVTTKVALVTEQMSFNPLKKFDIMPQIVVGTPKALESALSKSRGFVGRNEMYRKFQGDSLPGGYDHFNWVIFDEVHSLDGEDGDALQRLIRAMSCKFLALSATVGNAQELRGWLERVKGDQLIGVECIDVIPDDPPVASPIPYKFDTKSGSLSVQIVKTLDSHSLTIKNLSTTTTVLELKRRIHSEWPGTTPGKQQLLLGTVDLIDNERTLESYGVFSSAQGVPVITMYSLVNMLTHQGRFINLQRYVWSAGALTVLSPLAAVDDVRSLQDGILANSSLSMTSRDSFLLWEEMNRLFPSEAVEKVSPYNFFGPDERITLQRSKDYEDLLKNALSDLSKSHPVETHELLYNFRLEDPVKEFDICDMILKLKERDMLPCLMFHLNSFEAIRLLQALLAGLEYRQKVAFPTYYLDKMAEKMALKKEADAAVKSTGKNAKELEERMKTGEIAGEQDFSVDPYEPHPDFRFSKGAIMSENEWIDLSDAMEKNDGYVKRDSQAMKDRPGKNQEILEHALMRGLRRGIGLYINEVSSPAYRKEVQRLASKGKLAVVVSDDSLAFGVNMPFRTCIFAGEMNGELTPLMAQQMSGRAGRRGLDTQGNLVYVGSKASFIRSLMIGKVSEITGAEHEPRYESMFLQVMLSSRFVGSARGDIMGGRTLSEHCAKSSPRIKDYTLSHSKKALADLGFIEEVDNVWQPNEANKCTYGTLNLVWEMREYLPESISIGRLLPDICDFMQPHAFSLSEKRNQDRLITFVSSFFSFFLQIVDRHPCKEGEVPLHENAYFSEAKPKELFMSWSAKFEKQQKNIPEYLSHLRSPVPPGTPLDSKMFMCMLDRKYMFEKLNYTERQEIKARMWKVGNVLKTMHNVLWPFTEYFDLLEIITRACFRHVLYLNKELITAQINFPNVSSMDCESRTDSSTAIVKPLHANTWRDSSEDEPPHTFPNPWTVAIEQSIERYKSWKALHSSASPTEVTDVLDRTQRIFNSLKPRDIKLIKVGVDFSDAALPLAIESCGAITESSGTLGAFQAIGVLAWFCVKIRPSVLNKFPLYLKALYESDLELVDESAIKAWHTSAAGTPAADPASYLPQGSSLTPADMAKLRTSCDPLVQWLDSAEDEDESEEED